MRASNINDPLPKFINMDGIELPEMTPKLNSKQSSTIQNDEILVIDANPATSNGYNRENLKILPYSNTEILNDDMEDEKSNTTLSKEKQNGAKRTYAKQRKEVRENRVIDLNPQLAEEASVSFYKEEKSNTKVSFSDYRKRVFFY